PSHPLTSRHRPSRCLSGVTPSTRTPVGPAVREVLAALGCLAQARPAVIPAAMPPVPVRQVRPERLVVAAPVPAALVVPLVREPRAVQELPVAAPVFPAVPELQAAPVHLAAVQEPRLV